MGGHFGLGANFGTAGVLGVLLLFLAAVLGVCHGGVNFGTSLGFGR